MDPLIQTLILLAVIGLISYLVIRFVPMPEPFDKIFLAVAVIGTVLWLLARFGLFHVS